MPSRHRARLPLGPAAPAAVLASAALCLVATLPASAATAPSGGADLRVDADRDGTVGLAAGSADESAEGRTTALFLPNLDDDSNRCAETDAKGRLLATAVLAACNDAADLVVNGAADARDLAEVRSVPSRVRTGATARLASTAARHVNVFVLRGATWVRVTGSTRFTAAELRAGLRLGVEGRDVVRDRTVWDGTVTLTLTVGGDGGATSTDRVRMQVAPMLTHRTTQATDQVLVLGAGKDPDDPQTTFNSALRQAVSAAGVPGGVRELAARTFDDTWVQDFVEPMYANVPAPGGVRSVRLLLGSDQPSRTRATGTRGDALFTLRGKDVGVVVVGEDPQGGSRSSFGNLETIPAYTAGGQRHPLGRVVYGTAPDQPEDPGMSERTLGLLRAQGIQDPLALDTSFLLVGHVDEMMQFVPADTPRGWRVAVTDPLAGLELLRRARAAGHGSSLVVEHEGERMTVDAALRPGSDGIVTDNERAARVIEANLATVVAATGIGTADVVRVPGLYSDLGALGDDRAAALADRVGEDAAARALAEATAAAPPLAALVPGAINGIVLGRTVVVPQQFGVRVDGRDLFADAVTRAYVGAGLTTRFVDGWIYHEGTGEIHCGTNTLRTTTDAWWRAT